MRNPVLKLTVAIILALCSPLVQPNGIAGAIKPAAAAEAPLIDVSGAWQSNFGVVNLKVEGKDNDGNEVISGSWNNGAAYIVYGRYIPRTVGGALVMEYYVPARKHYGFAEFKFDATNTVLNGKYYETSQSGDWTLSRTRGFRPTTLDKLAVITNLGQNKTSPTLTNVVGLWNSEFGQVELQSSGYSLGVLIKGKFTRPDGKVGQIVSGTFTRDQKGGTLKFQYVTPWNKGSGSGTFHPDPHIPNRQMLGTYDESRQKGEWTLSRPITP